MKLGVGFATLLAAASASLTYGVSIDGQPRALCHGTQRLTAISQQADPSWSPDGSEYAFGNVDGIAVANAHGDVLHSLDTPDSGELRYDPAWSPVGDWIAFVTGYYGQGIELLSPDGSRSRGVPNSYGGIESETSSPTWSPDGTHLDYAYSVSDPSRGPNGVYSIGIDGSDRHLVVRDGEDPALSPDGGRLAYVKVTWRGTYGDDRDLFVSKADGNDEERLTSTPTLDETNPAWSPDGRTLAFEVGTARIEQIDLPTGQVRTAVQASPGFSLTPPAWRPPSPVPAGRAQRCVIEGTPKADVLIGTKLGDIIVGGRGNDVIRGGAGDDIIVGGRGHDHLYGGPGNDTFFDQDRWVDWIDGGPGQDTATCDFYDHRRSVEQYCGY
jgi:Tol biopolymer transport system component